MLYKIIISIVFLLSIAGLTAHSQQPDTLTEGKSYEAIDAPLSYYFTRDSLTLMIKFSDSEIVLQKVNTYSLEIINTNKYPLKGIENNLEYVGEIGNDFYVFYSKWISETKTYQLNKIKINFENMRVTEDKNPLCIVDKKLRINSKKQYQINGVGSYYNTRGRFNITLSENKNNILIVFRKYPKTKNNEKSFEELGIVVLNYKLESLWEKFVVMPYSEQRIDYADYTIDSIGNAYLLVKVYHTNKRADFHYELFSYKAFNGEFQKQKVFPSFEFMDNVILFNHNKHIICIGLNILDKETLSYNDKKYNFSKAIVYNRFNLNPSLITEKSITFPLEIINQNIKPKEAAKNNEKAKLDKLGIQDLLLQSISIDEEDNITIIGEQFFTESTSGMTSSATGMTSGGKSENYFNHIFALKLDSDGNLIWLNKIPKRQVKGGSLSNIDYRGSLSYIHHKNNTNHYIAFLDNPLNNNLSYNQPPSSLKYGHHGVLKVYRINNLSGELSCYSSFKTDEIEGFEIDNFKINHYVITEDNYLLLEVDKERNTNAILKIQLR